MRAISIAQPLLKQRSKEGWGDHFSSRLDHVPVLFFHNRNAHGTPIRPPLHQESRDQCAYYERVNANGALIESINRSVEHGNSSSYRPMERNLVPWVLYAM